MAEYTDFAGLLRLAAAEALSTDGWAFTGRNIDIIDRLLRAGAVSHRHDAHAALANPDTTPPGVALANTGGQIPADLPIAVGYTWIDADGGETTLSPITTVTTDPGLSSPTDAPTATVDHLAGSLLAQTYYYAVTVVDGSGGETPLGPSAIVTVPSGFAASEVVLSDLDTIVSSVGGVGWRMWRSVAGGQFALIATGTTADFTDDGINCVDCAVQPPDPDIGLGTTASTNRIIVTVPAIHPTGAVKFRIYASLDGSFVAPALLGEFDDTDFGTAIEFTSLTLLDESPPPVSNTLQGADKIDPDTDMLDFPWKRPVDDVVDLPPTGNTEGDVRLVNSVPPTFYAWDGTAWQPFSSGHIIQDGTPSAMPTRPILRFEGMGVQVDDVGVDSATVVLIPGKDVADEGTPLPYQPLIDFVGSGVDVTDDPVEGKTVVTISGGGGGSGHTVQDEGTPLADEPNLNFVGAGVVVTDDSANNATLVTIAGGGGGGSAHVIEDEGTPLADQPVLDFIGDGVTVGDDPVNGKTVVLVPRDGHDIYDEGLGGSAMTQRTGLSFEGAGVTVTDNSADDLTVVTIPGGGGGSGHTIEDETTPLTARSALNFEGAGVTVTDDAGNNATVVTIPGGGGGGGSAEVAIFTASFVSLASAGNGVFDWNETRDDGAHWTVGNAVGFGTDSDLTCSAAGVYIVEFTYEIQVGAYWCLVDFRHYNSTLTLLRDYQDTRAAVNPIGSAPTISGTHTIEVASGDVLLPIASQDSGSSKNATNPKFVITKVA